ncbi:MAG: hypothetical protein ACTHK1_05270 [Actinomycetales bacterium]
MDLSPALLTLAAETAARFPLPPFAAAHVAAVTAEILKSRTSSTDGVGRGEQPLAA